MAKNRSFADKIKGKSDLLICKCGGVIKMINKFKNGKLIPEAKCSSCGKKARNPKDLMER